MAERVEDWPRILTHYRKVEVLATRPEGRIVEMSAYRAGVPAPVRWRAIQRVEDRSDGSAVLPRVVYRHIGGITRGMEVAWLLAPVDGGVDVTIVHDFAPNWPWPGRLIARYIVCDFFVHAIADRTLAGIKAAAEQGERRNRTHSRRAATLGEQVAETGKHR